MRLTVDLINSSLSYLNPLKERELDLRGHKIPTIENLGVAKKILGRRNDGIHSDQDAIDFTDNDISALGNFPLFPRLRTLLLARNRIASIQAALAQSLPNLVTLVLTANNLAELADLDPLAGLRRLTHLVLLENPVTRKEHYRYWVIWRCPSVRYFDYARVTDAERRKAAELFGIAKEPSPLASKIMGIKSRTFDVPSSIGSGSGTTTTIATLPPPPSSSASLLGAGAEKQQPRIKLTPEERRRVEDMIRNAKSLAEIARLEKELNEGRVPGGIRA